MTVKLKKQVNKKYTSLFIEVHRGRGGRIFLDQWLYNGPRLTPEQKEHNKQSMILAEKRVADVKTEQLYHGSDLALPHRNNSLVIDYMRKYRDKYTAKDFRKVDAVIDKWIKFGAEKLMFSSINENVVDDFKRYLVNNKMSETARAYFTKFKHILKRAKIDMYLRYDVKTYDGRIPAGNKKLSKEILNPDEIALIAKTNCDNNTIKMAAIFCWFTGLDFADMYELQWSLHIHGEYMRKPREKTGQSRLTPLHQSALDILAKMDIKTKYVFQKLPNRDKRAYCANACNKTLKALVERAGIKKHITWHSLRHSFGTWMDADELTVAELLGHSDTSMVKVYRRIRDENKKAAINSLQAVEIK